MLLDLPSSMWFLGEPNGVTICFAMKTTGKLLQNIPFYPLLLGTYPVLFLWEANYFQVNASAVLRSLLISVVITLVVCLGSLALLRNLQKSALLAGLFLVLFFTYGHIHEVINNLEIFGLLIGKHRYQLLLWGILFSSGVYWIVRTQSNLYNLNKTLNLVVSLIVILILAQLSRQTIEDLRANLQNSNGPHPLIPNTGTKSATTPDLYFFILDAYSREDFLKRDVQLDNHEFINQLEQLGFIVPNCTQSNYNTTIESLDSTLNMQYIDELGYSYQRIAKMGSFTYIEPMRNQIRKNQVLAYLREMGYKIITLKNEYSFLNIPKSDIVFDIKSQINVVGRAEAIKFQYMFLKTTGILYLFDQSIFSPQTYINLPNFVLQFINPDLVQSDTGINQQLYQQETFQLDQLETVAQIPGKKFLYAHIMVTHPPYLFTRNGGLRADTRDNAQAYADQITYANQRMLKIIQNILSQSKTPPIIILQGDHAKGWASAGIDGFKILNAYYLPGTGKNRLYATITPVNSFRLILSEYFGKGYPLLPDQSIEFDSKAENGYQVIPESCVK